LPARYGLLRVLPPMLLRRVLVLSK
jgi:hypothetical protein